MALIATNTFNEELPQQRIGLVASSGELAVLNNGQLERYYVIKETLEGTLDTLYSLDAHQEQDSAGNSLLTLPQESLKSADGVPMAFSLVDGELTFGNDTFLQANE